MGTRCYRASFVTTKYKTTSRPAGITQRLFERPSISFYVPNEIIDFGGGDVLLSNRNERRHICKSDMNYESLSGQMLVMAGMKTHSRVKREKKKERKNRLLQLCVMNMQLVGGPEAP